MAVLQAAIPVGVLLGYSTAALLAVYLDRHDKPHHWRLVFILQALVLAPASYLLWYTRDEHLGVFPWAAPPPLGHVGAANAHQLGIMRSSRGDGAGESFEADGASGRNARSAGAGTSGVDATRSLDTVSGSSSPLMIGSKGSAFQPVGQVPLASGLSPRSISATGAMPYQGQTLGGTTFDKVGGGQATSSAEGLKPHHLSSSAGIHMPPLASTPVNRPSGSPNQTSHPSSRKKGIKQTTTSRRNTGENSPSAAPLSPSASSNASMSPSSSPLRISDVLAREDRHQEGSVALPPQDPSSHGIHQVLPELDMQAADPGERSIAIEATTVTSVTSFATKTNIDASTSLSVASSVDAAGVNVEQNQQQHVIEGTLNEQEEEFERPGGGIILAWCRPVIMTCVSLRRRFDEMMGLARTLLSIPTYASLLLALVSLYFITAGLQFYSTAYFIVGLGMPPRAAYFDVGLTLATAPACGVAAGGGVVELVLGGYRGRKRLAALRRCAYLSILVTGAALIALVNPVNQPTAVAACLWVVTFLATAMLPALSGLLVSVVPRDLRAASGQSTGLIVNLLGNSLSVVVIGYAMNLFHDEASCDAQCTHVVGFRALMVWAIWPLVLVSLAAVEEIRRRDREIRAQEQEVADSRYRGRGVGSATELRSFGEVVSSARGGINSAGSAGYGAIERLLDIRNPTPSPSTTPTFPQPSQASNGEGFSDAYQVPHVPHSDALDGIGSRDVRVHRDRAVAVPSLSRPNYPENPESPHDEARNPLVAGLAGFVQGILPAMPPQMSSSEGGATDGESMPARKDSSRLLQPELSGNNGRDVNLAGSMSFSRQELIEVGARAPFDARNYTSFARPRSSTRTGMPASALGTAGSIAGPRATGTPPAGSSQYTYYRSQYVALGRGDGSPPPAFPPAM